MPSFITCSLIMPKLRLALLNSWYQQPRWFTYCLLPFSFIFSFVVLARRKFYQWGLIKSFGFKVPVIVVGNITLGGTGKTPLITALVQYLQTKDYKPGIVSRGYKAKNKLWPQVVKSDSDPVQFGDEAVMLAKQVRVPVVVSPKRVDAVKYLLNNFSCDLVLSDDGLQHYALQRDIEIIVIDGKVRLGNGYCLPAGPLRETAARLKENSLVVINGGQADAHEYNMQLVTDKLYNLMQPERLWSLPLTEKVKVHAVAGIGFPQRFFDSLTQLGFEVIPHSFPDHHDFSFADIDLPDYPIIMTAKDAVKCQAFADQRHWCLAVSAQIDPYFLNALEQQLLLPIFN